MEISVETIKADETFKKAITNNLSKQSIHTYSESVMMFCRINKKYSFTDLVNEIREEQYDTISEGKVIRYNPDMGKVNQYFKNLITYYQDENKSVNTINTRIGHVRTVLKKVGIILPSKIKLETAQQKPRILSQTEISNILDYCDIWQKSYITFLACTGMRVHDFVNLTIDDFIDATFQYHNCIDVEEFLREAPNDMMGYWKFIPHKTKRIGLECRVCNTPESSNIILETLRIRADKLKEKGESLKGDDPLFISENNGWNRKLLKKTVTGTFWRINKKFQKELEESLLKQLQAREISKKEFNIKKECLPKLHPHGLRKFFTTSVRNYTSNRDVSLIMEGHTSPYKMDKHYVGVNDELFGDDVIKETYQQIIPYLTFQKRIDSKEYYQLRMVQDKYLEQVAINQELQKQINDMNALMKSILDKQSVIEKLGLE